MFNQPGHERVLHRHLSPQSIIEAELVRPEHAAGDPYAYFSPTIGLTISRMALFGGRPIETLDGCLEDFHGLFDQGEDGGLAVALQDYSRVA